MTSTRSVLVLAPYFTPARLAGGPVRTLSALVAQAPPEFSVDVVTRHADHGAALPDTVPASTWIDLSGHRVCYLPVGNPWRIVRALLKRRVDLVYLNSFFDVGFALLPQLALRAALRRSLVVVAPRGELSPGALTQKRLKKRALLVAYRGFGLHRRVVWHASAAREADEIRSALGSRVRVIVRENETALPLAAELAPVAPQQRLRAAFLSRLVPKKGLHILLGSLAESTHDLELDVYGVEEDAAYVRHCRALAARTGTAVTFNGAVDPERVRTVLADHDVLFFPTQSENFGHVIAEASSVSCPVVLPDTTPWSERVRRGGGTVLDVNDERAWAGAVEAWIQMSPSERHRRRTLAGAMYTEWRAQDAGPHIFELALPDEASAR